MFSQIAQSALDYYDLNLIGITLDERKENIKDEGIVREYNDVIHKIKELIDMIQRGGEIRCYSVHESKK
ncbi:MAG: hypothetical protein WAQ29_05360 [Nitrososphaeraceae archaeon]